MEHFTWKLALGIFTALLCCQFSLVISYGLRDLDEECDPDQGKYYNYQDESRKCKSEQGLHCSESTRRCRCHPDSGAYYNWDTRQCELPVDAFCAVSAVEWKNICVKDAVCMCNTYFYDKRRWKPCTFGNGFCKCKMGYSPFTDNSSCFWSRASLDKTPALINIVFVVGVGTVFTALFRPVPLVSL